MHFAAGRLDWANRSLSPGRPAVRSENESAGSMKCWNPCCRRAPRREDPGGPWSVCAKDCGNGGAAHRDGRIRMPARSVSEGAGSAALASDGMQADELPDWREFAMLEKGCSSPS